MHEQESAQPGKRLAFDQRVRDDILLQSRTSTLFQHHVFIEKKLIIRISAAASVAVFDFQSIYDKDSVFKV